MYEISLALPMYLISVNAIQVMVLDYKLTYPSGTATAMLINSFHTKSGAELAGYTNFTTQKLLYLYHSDTGPAICFWTSQSIVETP